MVKPIDILTDGAHSRAIEAGLCTMCGGEAREFRDELSRREYGISGMCQSCQNSVFEEDEA